MEQNTYQLTETEIQAICKILEDAPWKMAHPVMEILRQAIERKRLADEQK